jgi:hypothetical protein
MNITALEKLEKGWVTLDWKTHLDRMKLSETNLSELVDKLNNWKSNRKCKEIVLIKYKHLPVYITLHRSDFKPMGEWLMEKLKSLELYEECARLHKIWNKL